MSDEGFIQVGVEPSTDGAAAKFKRELETLEKRLDPVEIELAARIAKTFAQRAKAEATKAVKAVQVEMGIAPKLSKGFAVEARKVARKATEKVTAEIQIRAKTDTKEIRAQAQKAARQAETTRASMTMRFVADDKTAVSETARALKKAQAASQAISIRFEVSPQHLQEMLNRVATAMGQAQVAVSGRPLDMSFRADPQKAAAAVATAMSAAQEIATTNPIDVRFDVDPTKLATQVTGAVAAAEAAAPRVSTTKAGGGAAVAGAAAASGGGMGMLGAGMLGAGMLAPGAGVAALMAMSVDDATNLAEAQTKVNTVFREGAPLVDAWSKNAERALGQTQYQALEAAGTYGNLLQAFGLTAPEATEMSLAMATLASDLASFNNTEVQDALIALQSGISGESEPLKRFGVALTDVRMKEMALSKGLIKSTKEAMSPAVKAQAAYELILKDTTLAQGDFIRNSDGLANQQKIIQAQWGNLRAAMGAPFGEALQEFIPQLSELLSELSNEILDASGAMAGGLADLARELLPLVGPLFRAFVLIFQVFVETITHMAKSVLPVFLPMLEMFSDVLKWIGENGAIVQPILTAILTAIMGLVAVKTVVSIFGFFASAVSSVVAGLSALWGVISAVAGFIGGPALIAIAAVAAALYFAYQQSEPFREAVQGIAAVFVEDLWPAIQMVGDLFKTLFSGDFSKAGDIMGDIVGKIQDGVAKIGPLLGDAALAIFDWASNKIAEGWEALTTNIIPKMKELGSNLWGWIKDTLPDLIDQLGGALRAIIKWIGGPFLKAVVPAVAKAAWGIVKWFFTDGIKLVWGLGKWLLTDALPFLLKIIVQLATNAAKGLGTIFSVAIDYIWQGLQLLGGWFTSTALPWLGEAIAGLFKSAVGFLGDFTFWLFETLTGAVINLVALLPDIFVTLFEWFSQLPGFIVDAISAVGDLAGKLGGWMSETVTNFVQALPGFFQSVWDWFTNLPSSIADKIGDLSETLKDKGSDLIGGFWDGVMDAAEGGINFALDIARAFVGFVNDKIIGGINSGLRKYWPEWLPGDVPQIPEIPMFAKGGLVTKATVALVGEAGPELILPLTDPRRMAELLEEAGLGNLGAASIPVGNPASLALPDLAPVETWTSEVVTMLSEVPTDITAGQAKGMAAWAQQTSARLSAQGRMWDAWATNTTAATTRTWQTGLDRMVQATVTAGNSIAASMEGAINTSTPRLVLAVQGYAKALSGALNPVLSAIGADEIMLKFAEGGHVPGPRVNKDIVPALLMPGEVVIRRSSVEAFGVDNLLDLNEGRVPRGWQVPRFAEGGLATSLGSDAMQRAVRYADSAVGKPYVWGGVGPNGFDCSGLWSGIIAAVRDQTPRRLFTSSSLLTEAKKIGMLPGLGQISVGTVVGNPGHVGGTIGGVNYEATPPRVVKGAAARGANHPMFTHRFHVGNGFWLEPGQSIDLPDIPALAGAGILSKTAARSMSYTDKLAKAFVEENTFMSPTNLGDVMEAFTGSATAANAQNWITQAIRATGVPMSWLPGLMTIAKRESGFNPRAINQWDSNARKGVPSKGLMQTIDPTFRAHALPGYGDIWNPVHNAIAAIRYIQARYGDISRVQQANPLAAPRGYAEGGLVGASGGSWRDVVASLPDLRGRPLGSSGDIDRLIEAIREIESGKHFHLETTATTPDGQAAALMHRLAALLG